MRSIDSTFYKSTEWKRCREGYIKLHPFCEECLKKGSYTPATHVHHKIWLNENNALDPSVTLSWNNLEAVCIDCHNKIHGGRPERRYAVDLTGKVIALGP